MKPYIAKIITSDLLLAFKRFWLEQKRKITHKPHLITVYLRINDPYSYLLLQVLDKFKQDFAIEYQFSIILNLQDEMYPEAQMWQKNSLVDGCYLADLYQLSFPSSHSLTTEINSLFSDEIITVQLVKWQPDAEFITKALSLFHAYWQKDNTQLSSLLEPSTKQNPHQYLHQLKKNEEQLKQKGHYLSATLFYGGEWYWGLDRLVHLERRLQALNLAKSADRALYFTKSYQHFCSTKIDKKPSSLTQGTDIVMYWSLRSPYSYLALIRVIKLANHYQKKLVIKPVLPMVMRNLPVPKAKRFYIALDAKREANKYGIDFGFIADPLGKGVERCYALFDYAKSQEKEIDFLASYARGVWAEGIRSETDKGLKVIVERCGLDWQQAKILLSNNKWENWAEENLTELYQHNLWGVPSFIYQDTVVFGQDRLDCIEKAILI
jgi:2-hydroxychromene-2-carboxylate isomerase